MRRFLIWFGVLLGLWGGFSSAQAQGSQLPHLPHLWASQGVAPSQEVEKVILTPDGFVRRAVPGELGKRLSHGYISNELAMQISRIVAAAYRIRSLPTQPEDESALNALQSVGKSMLELLGIMDAPRVSLLTAKRSKGLFIQENEFIEYKEYGSFSNKLSGYVKIEPDSNALLCSLGFNGPKGRKVVFYGHITREGALTGTISVEIWDKRTLCWRAQAAMDALLVSKGSLPLSGSLLIGGIDPMGHFVEKMLVFPVKVYEE